MGKAQQFVSSTICAGIPGDLSGQCSSLPRFGKLVVIALNSRPYEKESAKPVCCRVMKGKDEQVLYLALPQKKSSNRVLFLEIEWLVHP
jgi:hypothetical protein